MDHVWKGMTENTRSWFLKIGKRGRKDVPARTTGALKQRGLIMEYEGKVFLNSRGCDLLQWHREHKSKR